MRLRIVAVLCVRNELAHLPRVLDDFASQGIDVAVIDHGSDDGSREVLRSWLGRGVVAIEDMPWRGEFDLGEQLDVKNALVDRLDYDWIIHADADEWLHSPRAGETLRDGIERHDLAGCTAINFEEFVFLPEAGQEVRDCKRELCNYYFFAPMTQRLMRAWKYSAGLNNVASGGHVLRGEHLVIAAEAFVLRHYIALSQTHVLAKYGTRVFSQRDLHRGWHHNRRELEASQLQFPDTSRLQSLPSWDSVKFDRSQPHTSHYWGWQQDDECDVLICIYTCDAHADLLGQFHASELGRFLREWQGARVIEVHADPALEQARFDGTRLTVPGEERYTSLSIKTQRMIAECVRRFRFQRLLKIDVTTIMTRMEGPEYEGRVPLDIPALIGFLRGSDPEQQYDGFILHAEAGRDGAETWAAKKGKTIDYPRLFGAAPMPPFFSGKCYLLGRRFAEFVANQGAEIATEHERFLLGAEDVMIGRLHRQYLAGEGT